MTTTVSAEEQLEARLDDTPADFSAWLELARLRNSGRQPHAALLAANNALILRPASLEALYELGSAQLELGHAGDAADVFASILTVQPLHPHVLVSLGAAYYRLQKLGQASLLWEQAVRVAPEPVAILGDLAVCYQRLGEFEKVAETWERVLTYKATHPQALHHLAALGKRPPPDRAPEEYVVQLFNEFAADFDVTLRCLGYDAPRLLAEIVAENTSKLPKNSWRILDAGCGTGFCGQHLRPWADRLEGVDLSPGMLEKAMERNLYDALHREELIRFCNETPGTFDLIIASDVLNYFGDLKMVIQKMSGGLRPGGRCAFSVEQMEHDRPGHYHLEHHGRFSHRPEYVADCLAAANLCVVAWNEAPIRSEAGKPVTATLFLAGL